MTSIPPQIGEAGNGALVAMLAIASIYFVSYIARAWREQGRYGLRRFYTYENKAALAMLTCSVGLFLHVGADWFAAHLRNHQLQPPPQGAILVAYLAGTLIALWGFVCLMHALARYDWPRSAWLWLAVGSVMFGIFMAT